MNNQINTQYAYVNHQINEPLNDETIISTLNPSIENVRSTSQFFVDTSNVNPYQEGTYNATIWCQIGDQKITKPFQINVKNFNQGQVSQTNQANTQPVEKPKKASTAKKIWIGILVFVLIVLGLTSCSIYNQAKTNQANDAAQNQQLKTELAEVKAAQKTYQQNHDKEQLDNALNDIKNDVNNNNSSNSSAINALQNQISSIENNPDKNGLQSEISNLENQISSQNGIIQEMQNTINSLINKISSMW